MWAETRTEYSRWHHRYRHDNDDGDDDDDDDDKTDERNDSGHQTHVVLRLLQNEHSCILTRYTD